MNSIFQRIFSLSVFGSILLVSILTSCDSSTTKSSSELTKDVEATKETTLIMQSPDGIPQEDVVKIATECTHIDFTFSELPISMNQSEKSAIIGDLSYISPEAVSEIITSCIPLARKVYYGPSGVIIEADIYFGEGCLYFVFIRDEELLFANRMNKNGVTFYNGVLSQVQSSNQ